MLIGSVHKPGTYLDAYGQKTIENLREFYGEAVSLRRGTPEMLATYAGANPLELKNFALEVLRMDAADESHEYRESLRDNS